MEVTPVLVSAASSLTERDKTDLAMLEIAKQAAKWLGCGYRVLGVGPGVALVSDEFPRHPLDLADAHVRHLAALEADRGRLRQERDDEQKAAKAVLASMDDWLGNEDGLLIETVVEWRDQLAAALGDDPEAGR